MDDQVLQNEKPILLIGAGPVAAGMVQRVLPYCGGVAALDGGINHAQAANAAVDLYLGDMDSSTPNASVRSIELPDQSSNDFSKALPILRTPLLIALGCLGGRVDHQLANFSAMVCAKTPVAAVDDMVCVFAVPPNIDINLHIPAGADVAFYPLLPVKAYIGGTQWAVDGGEMAPDGLISTSNKMQGDMLHLHTDRAGLLAIVPVQALPEIVNCFLTLAQSPKPPNPPQR